MQVTGDGSSPRPRGTRDVADRCGAAQRFIPASAGNTLSAHLNWRTNSVHPRVRGEHSYSVLPPTLTSGSSPRPRGTRLPAPHVDVRLRFIPASAGNTFSGSPAATAMTVHPRVRGEHVLRLAGRDCDDGSSPRPRGTRRPSSDASCSIRFIPASAGNTPVPSPLSNCCSVHPRVRGEHSLMGRRRPSCSGSSPRPRGTPAGDVSKRAQGRFIPASAGNTPSVSDI